MTGSEQAKETESILNEAKPIRNNTVPIEKFKKYTSIFKDQINEI